LVVVVVAAVAAAAAEAVAAATVVVVVVVVSTAAAVVVVVVVRGIYEMSLVSLWTYFIFLQRAGNLLCVCFNAKNGICHVACGGQ
jgi:hypothetical protein